MIVGHQTSSPPEGLLTTPQVCKKLGINYRQLDYWIRKGYVSNTCPGSGRVRLWTPDQVARVVEVCDAIEDAREILRKAGLETFTNWPERVVF